MPFTSNQMTIKTIFINPEQQRLRAGWRLLIQTILMSALEIIVLGILFFIPLFQRTSSNELLTFQILELFSITISIFLVRRLIDRRSVTSLGLKIDRQMVKDLLIGIGIPALMMGLIYLLEWSFGWLTFQGFAWEIESPSRVLNKTLPLLLAFILVGWNEELLSRGYSSIQRGPIEGIERDGWFEYFDTTRDFGACLELLDIPGVLGETGERYPKE